MKWLPIGDKKDMPDAILAGRATWKYPVVMRWDYLWNEWHFVGGVRSDMPTHYTPLPRMTDIPQVPNA